MKHVFHSLLMGDGSSLETSSSISSSTALFSIQNELSDSSSSSSVLGSLSSSSSSPLTVSVTEEARKVIRNMERIVVDPRAGKHRLLAPSPSSLSPPSAAVSSSSSSFSSAGQIRAEGDADCQNLETFVFWLFTQFGSLETVYRRECMRIFVSFVPYASPPPPLSAPSVSAALGLSSSSSTSSSSSSSASTWISSHLLVPSCLSRVRHDNSSDSVADLFSQPRDHDGDIELFDSDLASVPAASVAADSASYEQKSDKYNGFLYVVERNGQFRFPEIPSFPDSASFSASSSSISSPSSSGSASSSIGSGALPLSQSQSQSIGGRGGAASSSSSSPVNDSAPKCTEVQFRFTLLIHSSFFLVLFLQSRSHIRSFLAFLSTFFNHLLIGPSFSVDFHSCSHFYLFFFSMFCSLIYNWLASLSSTLDAYTILIRQNLIPRNDLLTLLGASRPRSMLIGALTEFLRRVHFSSPLVSTAHAMADGGGAQIKVKQERPSSSSSSSDSVCHEQRGLCVFCCCYSALMMMMMMMMDEEEKGRTTESVFLRNILLLLFSWPVAQVPFSSSSSSSSPVLSSSSAPSDPFLNLDEVARTRLTQQQLILYTQARVCIPYFRFSYSRVHF